MLKRIGKSLGMSVVFVLALSVALVGYAADSDIEYALFDDFTSSDVGSAPEEWRLVGLDFAHFEVVEVSGTDSGRAVWILADDTSRKVANMRIHLSDSVVAGADVVAIEHKVHWVQGRSLNSYITKGSHRLHWTISDGGLAFRDGSRSNVIGMLKEGWNTLRLVASRESNQVYIYLNNMDRPAAGPLTFREAIDSWTGAELIFALTTNPGDPTEVFYGDVKVWVVE